MKGIYSVAHARDWLAKQRFGCSAIVVELFGLTFLRIVPSLNPSTFECHISLNLGARSLCDIKAFTSPTLSDDRRAAIVRLIPELSSWLLLDGDVS